MLIKQVLSKYHDISIIICRLYVKTIGVRVMVFNSNFSYIVAVSFIGGRNRVPGENHRSAASREDSA